MNRALFWSTFFTIFLAEVGDKTQLAALTATARTGAVWTVFLAASTALICATAVGVTFGAALFRALPPGALKGAAGCTFLAVGLWILVRG